MPANAMTGVTLPYAAGVYSRHQKHEGSVGTMVSRKNDNDDDNRLEREAAVEDSALVWQKHYPSSPQPKLKGWPSMPEVDCQQQWARVTPKENKTMGSYAIERPFHPRTTVDQTRLEDCLPKKTRRLICILPIQQQQQQLRRAPRSPSDTLPEHHFHYGVLSRLQKEEGSVLKQELEARPKGLRRSLSSFFSNDKGQGISWIRRLRRASSRISVLRHKEKGGPAASLRQKSSFLLSRCRSFATNKIGSPSTLAPEVVDSNYGCRLPTHVEHSVYNLSFTKLANPLRPLQQRVVILNLMFNYLSIQAKDLSSSSAI